MTFNETIDFCPRCGSGDFPEKSPGFFLCAACDFHFHPNCSVAVVGIIVNDAGQVLLIRRGRNPGKGKWSVPGGFADKGETAEEALAREVKEEVGLDVAEMTYLCSFPNPYDYKGVVFSVLDFIYICRVRAWETLKAAPDEVGAHGLFAPADIPLDEIAFPSVRHGLELFRQKSGALKMAYSKFTLAEALKTFGLTTDNSADLFPHVAPVPPSDWLKATLEQTEPLARQIATEKARSEFIVSPILAEVYRRALPEVGLFSGVDFPVDDKQGLNGVCDYLLTHSREHAVIAAPVLAIVEAKKEDLKPGMGQCIASMVAARLFNEREGKPDSEIYGAVTTGTNWQFLKLDGDIVRVDRAERFLNGAGQILGILFHIARVRV